VLLLAALAAAGAFSAGAARADNATLLITYTGPSSLQVKLGSGTVVTQGSTIPAGTYTVLVYDAAVNTNPKLVISGPGVNLVTDLNGTGMGLDQTAQFGPYTFETSSTYTIEDTNVGASTLVSFSTSATTTATASTGSTSSVASTGSGGSHSGGGSGSSSGAELAGTLTASVSSSGSASLLLDGKKVKALKAGRYQVTIADRSRAAGLTVGKDSTHITLSSTAGTGTSSRTLTLSAGRWYVEPSAHGPRSWFTVVS
jgi:hypothetical protein